MTHIYRWDLDKTYLDTEFDTVRGLIRTALEPAARKRCIPGAAALLRALNQHEPSSRVWILSGSPTQMRPVLEEKLALDGVRYDQLVLKDNLGNLRRGRIRAVRGQLGYKLPRLLQQRVGRDPSSGETLFGDDAEVDALVYTMYADAVAGRLSVQRLADLMEMGGAYADAIEDAVRALRQVTTGEVVEDIFIHLDRKTPLRRFSLLGRRVIPIFSWFQAALVLWERGHLGPHGVRSVASACAEEAELSDLALAGLVQDLVRRGHASHDGLERLLAQLPELEASSEAIRRALLRLGPTPVPPRPGRTVDYPGFLRWRKTGP